MQTDISLSKIDARILALRYADNEMAFMNEDNAIKLKYSRIVLNKYLSINNLLEPSTIIGHQKYDGSTDY